MGSRVRQIALALVALAPAAASAQNLPASASAPEAPAPAQPAAAQASAAPSAAPSTATGQPAASDAAPAPELATPKNITGYGYGYKSASPPSDKPVVVHHAAPRHVAGPVATLPGFSMLGEGGSRFFVELTQAVPVEEKRAAGSITYVLKGAHIQHWNNTNALVTRNFNTPVDRARLAPSGKDLVFVVDLRPNTDASPTYHVDNGKDGTAILNIDFPAGDYAAAAAAATDAPTPPAGSGTEHHHHHRHAR